MSDNYPAAEPARSQCRRSVWARFDLPFLHSQFTWLLESFRTRRSLRHQLRIFPEGLRLLANHVAFQRALRGDRLPGGIAGDPSCTVVLLSHNRPQNMRLLVRAALRNPFVQRVIVSNSAPNLRIEDWIDLRNPRLVLRNETRPTRPALRWILAAEQPAEFFLSVDDDIFLTPRQWSALFGQLLAGPAVPHGVFGQVYRPGTSSSNGSPFHHRARVNAPVDVLIGAYAFAREHLDRATELARRLGLGPLDQVVHDDILLSLSGADLPRIHDLGSVFCCASASLPGIALRKTQPNFWTERVRLFEAGRKARAAMPGPWPPAADVAPAGP